MSSASHTIASDVPDEGSKGLIRRVAQAAILPKKITAFEASYLRRMNRIALWFFYAHLPAFMLVAWANRTGVLSVTLMTLAVLAVPTLGCRAVQSERVKSYVFAFTSMCMGGVLVHAGQGPVQIEMHFYFFSILAMLALFANPMTVIVGAATVAVHHLALWYLAPASVFNYDAPLWVVLVHANFVALEAIAAGFIARNFFDNVIGLEKRVEARTAELCERNREMQTVLDSIEQGIVMVDAKCSIQPEHSTAIVRFFGQYEPGETFSDLLSRSCVTTAEWFSMNWDALEEGFLPLELAIDQLPKAAKIAGSSYTFEYKPSFHEEGEMVDMLIVVSDITNDVAREHAEALQRELLTIFERAMGDPRGFAAFYQESERLLKEIASASHADTQSSERLALHTMKGNAAAYGLGSIASLCHSLENAWSEGDTRAAESVFDALTARWAELGTIASRLMGSVDEDSIMVRSSDLEAILQASIDAGATDVAQLVSHALLEPTSTVLARLESQAQAIAARLDRGHLRTIIESHDARVPPGTISAFWSSLIHVVRNAIDHGIETPTERVAASKDASGQLAISTEVVGASLIITVEDDGRGVDWNKVRAKAQALGLSHGTPEDLTAALFAADLSTRDDVTDLSGRGVGLAVVAEAVEALHGSIQVESSPGQGTTMRFTLPLGASTCTPS